MIIVIQHTFYEARSDDQLHKLHRFLIGHQGFFYGIGLIKYITRFSIINDFINGLIKN